MTAADESTFCAADGTDMFYPRWRPDGGVRAAVVILHGASEHSARYDRFARFLADASIARGVSSGRRHADRSAPSPSSRSTTSLSRHTTRHA